MLHPLGGELCFDFIKPYTEPSLRPDEEARPHTIRPEVPLLLKIAPG